VARLVRWTIVLPDEAARSAVVDRVAEAGGSPEERDGDIAITDPSGIEALLVLET
jgi:hypothetical protein